MHPGETFAHIAATDETAEKQNECVQVVLTGPRDACHLLAKLIQALEGFSVEAENPEYWEGRQPVSAGSSSILLLCYESDETATPSSAPRISCLPGEVEMGWQVSSPKDGEIGTYLNVSHVDSARSAPAEVTELANRKGGETSSSSTGNRNGLPEVSLPRMNVLQRQSLGLGCLKSNCNHLTSREEQTARLAAQGFSNAEIAERLGAKVATIKSHLQNVFTKLDLKRRSQLVTLFQAAPPISEAPDT